MPYPFSETRTTRAFLALGILGTIIMFTGDMLLYCDPGHAEMTPESIVATMRTLNPYRVMAGGALGPLATLPYLCGYLGVAAMVRPEYPRVRLWLFLVFSVGGLYGGAYHSHFPTMAFAAGDAVTGGSAKIDEYIDYLGLAAFGLWAVGSLIFHFAVLSGRAYCRKWVVLFAPLPMALAIFAFVHLPPPFLIVIAGGWYCLMMTLFFAVCLLETRRRP